MTNISLKKNDFLNTIGIIRGLIVVFLIIAVGIILISFLSMLFNLSQTKIDQFLVILNYASLFVGGIVAAYFAKNKGWLHGGSVALSYLIIVLALGGVWISVTLSISLLFRFIVALAVAMIGGMIGVNII